MPKSSQPASIRSNRTLKQANKPKLDGTVKEVKVVPTAASKKRKTASDFMEVDVVVDGEEKGAATSEKVTKKTKISTKAVGPTPSATTGGEKSSTTPLKSSLKKIKEPVVVEASTSKPKATTSKAKVVKATTKATPTTTTKKSTTSTTKKTPVVEAAVAEEEDDDDDDFIHGFSSSEGEDSSDDSDMEIDDAAIKASKSGKGRSSSSGVSTGVAGGKGSSVSTGDGELSMNQVMGEVRKLDSGKILGGILRNDEVVKRRLEKAKAKKDSQKGVIYLGRIPHGFYEDEMKAYFSQFGEVTRLRLARNKKTGASKHFAYIELSSKSVAEITAETMNNYLLMGRILQCAVVPPEKIHPDLWVGANKKWRKVPGARVERMIHDRARTIEEQEKANANLIKKDTARKEKIKSLGIDYEYEGYKA